MTIWADLRSELLRLQEEQPDALQSYPNPQPLDRPPPYAITLDPSAIAAAEALHRRFGQQVELRVGALPYPPAEDTSIFAPPLDDTHPPGLPAGVTVELAPPLTVRSGETKRHRLLVSNAADADLTLHTNGQLIGKVWELATGTHVGGLAGAMRMPLIAFTLRAGRTIPVPLLVGTASYRRELGFSIPPGSWGLTADLKFADGRVARTPLLNFEITP